MTTEELGAIRKWALGPGPHNVYQLEKDVRALCDEVDRLQGQVQLLRRALAGVMGTDPDSRKMLELMRKVITIVPAVSSEKDEAVALGAIDALLATMP